MFYNALKAVQPTNFRDKKSRIEDLGNYFIAKTTNMFKYDGLPPTIPVRALEMILQQYGYVVITEVNGELYPLYGGLGGAPNPYYMPTIATVANPALNFSAMLEIGKECIVFPNDSAYMGLGALISKYATLIAENELSFYTGIIHSRLFPILIAEDNTGKQSCELYLKKMEEGTTGVITSTAFMESVKVQPLTNFVPPFTEMIEMQEYLKGAFYEEIGLDYQTNLKRENISESELDVGQYPMQTLVQDMLAQRKIGVELINKMYGTEISVEFSRTWEKQEQDVFDVKHIVDDNNMLDEQTEPTDPQPTEETVENDITEPTEEQTEDTADEQTEDPTDEQTEDPTEEPAEDPTEESAEEQTEEPAEEQTEETVYDENQITALDIGVDEFIEDKIIDDVIEVEADDTE